jgi:hypothetical protein
VTISTTSARSKAVDEPGKANCWPMRRADRRHNFPLGIGDICVETHNTASTWKKTGQPATNYGW